MTLRRNSKLSLAPMMEYTDRHFRHLVRLVSDRTLVYTEMVAANAIVAGQRRCPSSSSSLSSSSSSLSNDDNDNFIRGDDVDNENDNDNEDRNDERLGRLLGWGRHHEGPSVLQLGGSDPKQMFDAARSVHILNRKSGRGGGGGGRWRGIDIDVDDVVGASATSSSHSRMACCDYTAINLNCGCPSPRVAGRGCFGAALMSDPNLVRRLSTSLHEGCDGTMPISVKCRIGTDANYGFTREVYAMRDPEEEYRELREFVLKVADGGIVTDFQVHARIAVLSRGYSPADNRKVPPLRYDHVRRLATEFPTLNVSLNGGVDTLFGVRRELETCDKLEGIMVGRGYVADPWSFAMADELLYPLHECDDDARVGRVAGRVGEVARPRNRMEVLERYGVHADHEERTWGSRRVRRPVLRAITNLFAGEHNSRRYRIALDEIAGSLRGMNAGDDDEDVAMGAVAPGPPLSELIMRAAALHLSEEVLYRSPEESYEKSVYDEERAEERGRNGATSTVILGGVSGADSNDDRRSSVLEWQASRMEDEQIDLARNSDEKITLGSE
jgi:tRNA-dihydrouridine synthase A